MHAVIEEVDGDIIGCTIMAEHRSAVIYGTAIMKHNSSKAPELIETLLVDDESISENNRRLTIHNANFVGFRTLVISLLSDENGISSASWGMLEKMICDHQEYSDILHNVRMHDDRWYLHEKIPDQMDSL